MCIHQCNTDPNQGTCYRKSRDEALPIASTLMSSPMRTRYYKVLHPVYTQPLYTKRMKYDCRKKYVFFWGGHMALFLLNEARMYLCYAVQDS